MSLNGLIIGVAAFAIIGAFHPVVIKCEYHFTYKIWPAFLVVGLAALAASCFIGHAILSAVLAIFGCASLWSIIELREQRERVEKGWFPRNPARDAAQPREGDETRLGG